MPSMGGSGRSGGDDPSGNNGSRGSSGVGGGSNGNSTSGYSDDGTYHMADTVVTAVREPNGLKTDSENGREGFDFDFDTTELDSALATGDTQTIAQKVKTYLKKALAYGLTQNVIAKNLQKLADFAGLNIDLESIVATALTSIKTADPTLSDEAANTKALQEGITTALASVTDQGGEQAATDWFGEGLAASFQEAEIDPETGASTGAAPGSWDDYVDQFFGSDEGMASARDMLIGQADFIKQQYNDWQGKSDKALADYTSATQERTGLLDSLIEQSETSTGLFSPVEFTLAGKQVAFVPKAQRAQADQQAQFSSDKLGASSSLYGAQTAAADTSLANSTAAAPNTGQLAYLDQLRQLATTGESIDVARDTLTSNNENAAASLEAGEPGILDYIQGISTLFG